MHPYQNREAVITTKHGKLELFQPAFAALGLKIKAIELDTDAFGTFSGETPRLKSPLETAVAKARSGMAASGVKLGFASEGTIGADAQIPFVNSDVELAVLVDDDAGIVIWESYRSLEIVAFQKPVDLATDLSGLLEQIDFPNQRLIARPEGNPEQPAVKGIASLNELQGAIALLQDESPTGKVLLEPDFRAHFCPSRRPNIEAVAQLLAKRVQNLCKACQSPGFGLLRYETGLRCADCGLVNPEAISRELLCCVSCSHQEPGEQRPALSPANCDNCNP